MTKIFLSRGISLPTLPHTSQNNERCVRPKCTKHKNTTVLKKLLRTICVVKRWLNGQLASFEALLSLEKTIGDPTPSMSAVSLHCVLSYENHIRQNCVVCSVFSYHIRGTCPVKEFSWSRNCAFFWTEKRPRRTTRPEPAQAKYRPRPLLPIDCPVLLQKHFLHIFWANKSHVNSSVAFKYRGVPMRPFDTQITGLAHHCSCKSCHLSPRLNFSNLFHPGFSLFMMQY